MKLPRMTETERAVFAACYARGLDRYEPGISNEQADAALEDALWQLQNFRQAIRERKP
jgi:hypothetical protein